MNKICLSLLAIMAIATAHAQFSFAVKRQDPSFNSAVETILGDFPYNYRHITGDLVLAQGEWEEYASTITLPGAESCVIGKSHSVLDSTASWQAVMYRNEDFEKASQEYKRLFQQLKSCKLKMVDGTLYYITGNFEAASESMPFATSTLKIQTADERFRNFKIEVEMLYQQAEWVININMVSKKEDKDVRPEVVEQ